MLGRESSARVQALRNLLSRTKSAEVAGTARGVGSAAAAQSPFMVTAGAVLLAAATLLFGFQSWQVWRSESLQGSAEGVAAQARQSIAGFVTERQRANLEAYTRHSLAIANHTI